MKIEDLSVNDIVQVDYMDVGEGCDILGSISKVIHIENGKVNFEDIISLSNIGLDYDWTAEDGAIKIHKILFNYNPISELEMIEKNFPEYIL